jgi:anaerobic magnesium-protoporphyrin IX monomethyl ester cyclase
VSTSRGCSHGCTFCSQQKFWKKIWRGRSPEKVIEEIKHINRLHGVNVILFTDEYPTYDRNRWEELLDRIISEKLDIFILIETRVEDIVRDKDILSKYRKAGIIHIYVGAEATDQQTLDKINKEITVSDSGLAIELIAEYGMISETSFVLGFPLAITPWPYSDFYHEVKDRIAISDYRKYNLIEPIIKPDSMTLNDIDLAIIDCYRRYYMPKMMEFRKIRDKFRRDYLISSTKRLGVNPKALMQSMLKS